jgi:hypothetical protein
MASQGAAGWLGAVTGIGRRWATLMSRDSQLLRNAYRHLADEIDDPHLHVTKRGKKRFNPPTCHQSDSGRVQLIKSAEIATVHNVVDEPSYNLPRVCV